MKRWRMTGKKKWNIVRRLQLFWEQGKKMMSKIRTRDSWLKATNLDANGKEISRTNEDYADIYTQSKHGDMSSNNEQTQILF